jgi:hypothetical protein
MSIPLLAHVLYSTILFLRRKLGMTCMIPRVSGVGLN